MFATLRVPLYVLLGSVALAGCSGGDLFGSSSSDVTTSSLTQPQTAQKIDPACGNLAVEIDTLRREGVAEKVEKAAAKKYKMTPADLTKANQLNKVNADYQEKCSTLPRTAATPVSAAPATASAVTTKAAPAAKAVAAKAVPAAAGATAGGMPVPGAAVTR